MDTRVCLDTNTAIAIIKGDKRLGKLIQKLPGCEVAISSITVFELLLRENNLDIAKRFINDLEILPFRASEALKASVIFKDLKHKGLIIDIKDIFIGATCIVNDYSIATLNKKHFERIKELKIFDY